MNRREFLKSVLGSAVMGAAYPFVPTTNAEGIPLTVANLRRYSTEHPLFLRQELILTASGLETATRELFGRAYKAKGKSLAETRQCILDMWGLSEVDVPPEGKGLVLEEGQPE